MLINQLKMIAIVASRGIAVVSYLFFNHKQ